MPHSKRRRHEIASWWLSALPDMQPPPTNNSDTAEKEKDVKIAGRGHHAQQGRTVSSLKEGENWLTVDAGQVQVGGSEPKIAITRGPTKHAKSDALQGAMRTEEQQPEHDDNNIDAAQLPMLCIDVDNTSKCVAVKDIRDEVDPESQLEFFLVRRKRARCSQSDNNDHAPNSKMSKLEGSTCESDEMSSSGYTTDDEKEDAEDLHETTASNKINGQHNYTESLPKESDVDSEGSPLYEHPEPLPSRQLRILRDGDRLITRYTPKTTAPNSPSPRIAKLEYIYARTKKRQHKEHYRMKAVETTPAGKPRLLSVKSDVKSKFKTNDTSAAEAPSDDDDDISIKATKDHHMAGKDWSAVDDNAAEAKKENNHSQGGADDEDDGMEEYSYLTGEIVMKDQDYVSALTGDEGPILPNPNSNAREENGFSENDAATASAVVVGANDNRATANNHRSSSPGRCKKEKEVSFDAKFSPRKTSSPKGKGEGPGFEVLEERKCANSHEQVFSTANTKEEEDEEELSMEEELLRQPSEKDDNNDDLTDDISQTQPLPEGFFVDDNPDDDSHPSLSGVEEAAKEDDDSSTTCAEDQKLPTQVEVASLKKGEVRFSQLTPNSKRSKKDDDSEDEAFHAETQFESPALRVHESEEEEYFAETQFAPPAAVFYVRQQEAHGDSKERSSEEAESMEVPILPGVQNVSNNATDAQPNPVDGAEQEQSEVHGAGANKNLAAEESECPKPTKQSLAKESQSSKTSPKRSNYFLPTPHRSGSPKRSAYENAGLLSDNAIHRIQNGAMMTGSVGGANLGMTNFRGGTDRDLLTSIALQSTPNLPEAAMSHKSSEETTVVNDKGAKDFTSNTARKSRAGGHLNSSDMNTNQNGSAKRLTGNDNKSPIRNPSIPCEVFVATPVKDRRSSRSANKRSRRSLATPSSDAKEEIRIMFTGIDVTSKQKKMIQSIGAELVDTLEKAHTVTRKFTCDISV
ncbi:hypothetical protein ACHAWO_001213 [Cyclotella atomus]|uniref:BRCT domain-containing protein n=1 Tax=Cyclotella atomus TaxID=382360 RepID=A0ABD3NX35_9STRA